MLGVCYYPEHWPRALWAEDARRMRALGITYVRIAEFAWSRIEPRRDAREFGWLDEAIDVLAAAGLKIVMCTPTATPPKWLVDEMPDMVPVDEEGRPRGFGSRRHYSFSHAGWLREARRIVEVVAQRYGEHPAVTGWQTDNEYGCHDTILSWGAHDLAAFRDWLRRRYQTPEVLNEAWGNVFWSQEVGAFDEVALPNLTVTEANPAIRLDFWRFSSAQVLAFDRMQAEILRLHSPGRFVTHNFMGLFHDFDHWPFGEHLDLATWDSYPLGFTERFPFPEEEKLRWAETAHPDMAPFHHDLYRGVGRGRWWVMEQQPGPVNWAPWNPVPKPGVIRLFTWEALAHGAEVVSYFRWRQAPFAQEQFHAGLNRPDSVLSPGGEEAATVGAELARLGPLPDSTRAPVAFVFDYESSWVTRIEPQGADFLYVELTYRWYEAIRRLGVDVDMVPPGASLDRYRAVVVPTLPILSEDAVAAFRACRAPILFGPRTGSKTRTFHIPDGLPPGPLRDLIPVTVAEVASLRPGLTVPVAGEGLSGAAERWFEHMETRAEVVASADRHGRPMPAVVEAGAVTYCGVWPDAALLAGLIRRHLGRAGVPVTELPEGVRLRRRGPWVFAFNYGTEPFAIPGAVGEMLLGTPVLAPQDVACWRDPR